MRRTIHSTVKENKMLQLIHKIMQQNPNEIRIIPESVRLDDFPDDLADAEADLEEDAEREELHAALWQAVNDLPYREKEILIMSVVNGQTQETIAKRFGVTQPAIAETIKRTLAHLKTQLRDVYEGHEQ